MRADVLLLGAAGLVGSHLRDAFDAGRVVATYHRTPVDGSVPLDITDARAVGALVRETRPLLDPAAALAAMRATEP